MNQKVNDFLDKLEKWKPELEKLRTILLESELTEEWKWKTPCYTFKNGNVVLLGKFKE